MASFKDIMRRLAGRPEPAAAAAPTSASPWPATTSEAPSRSIDKPRAPRSDRLARLGLAPGAADAAEPADHAAGEPPRSSEQAPARSGGRHPAFAPAPTFRRDVGLLDTADHESAEAAEPTSDTSGAPAPQGVTPQAGPAATAAPVDAHAVKPSAQKTAGTRHRSFIPTRSSVHGERQRDRKRATFRLPTSLVGRLQAAARRSGRYQYMIVIDALRAYLPKLEDGALEEVGPALAVGGGASEAQPARFDGHAGPRPASD